MENEQCFRKHSSENMKVDIVYIRCQIQFEGVRLRVQRRWKHQQDRLWFSVAIFLIIWRWNRCFTLQTPVCWPILQRITLKLPIDGEDPIPPKPPMRMSKQNFNFRLICRRVCSPQVRIQTNWNATNVIWPSPLPSKPKSGRELVNRARELH